MSSNLTIINWCPCDDCDPCKAPLLNATPYETQVTTNVLKTYSIPGCVPQWAPVVVNMIDKQITTLSYNLTKGVQVFVDAPLSVPQAYCPYFAWPVVDLTIGSYEYVVYRGGGAGPKIIIPYKTMFGTWAINGGPGQPDTISFYNLRSDVGYALAQSLSIELSVSYLGVTIFETIVTFQYRGWLYSLDVPSYQITYGNAIYLLTGASMSNVPNTPFEVSPEIVDRMGLTFPGFGNPNQPINPETGNYMFTGFVYNGPIDPKQDIVIVAKAVSNAIAFMGPTCLNPQGVSAAWGDEYQPPYLYSQIAGCVLYGSRSEPLPFYDFPTF